MTWSMKMVDVEHDPIRGGFVVPTEDGRRPRVGEVFFAPWLLFDEDLRKRWAPHPVPYLKMGAQLSTRYFDTWASLRAPLIVVLPGPFLFCLDGMAWNASGFYGDGWTVSGNAPVLTVSPSISIGQTYHGFIQVGVIGDDVDGRKFDSDGNRL